MNFSDVNSPRKRNLNQLFSKMKLVKNAKAFAFRTAAQAHKNVSLKNKKKTAFFLENPEK